MSATVVSVLLIAICSAVTREDQIPIPPDTKMFISQIGIVLEETCARNTNLSAVPPAEGFNLGAMSYIPTERWLERAAKYGKVTGPVFVHSFIYLHQWSERQGQPLSLWNIDKLVAAAVTVAHKNHDDNFYANSWYAQIFGLEAEELNRLERNFLEQIEFDLFVSPARYQKAVKYLQYWSVKILDDEEDAPGQRRLLD